MARGCKGKRPEEGQYAPLPYALLKSPAWRALSGPATKVFLELHTRHHGPTTASCSCRSMRQLRRWA